MEKEYKISKTAAKTAKENNLVIADSYEKEKRLLDFSLLEDLEISDEEKEVIKKYAQSVSVAYKKSFYGESFDNFHTCNGTALYKPYKVYNNSTGKRLYVIYRLVAIKHYSSHRQSVYDEYKTTECKQKIGTGDAEPIDIEI